MQSQATDPAVVAAEIAFVRRRLEVADDVPIVFEDVGWDSRVYMIDEGRLVVKFARDHITKRQFEHEVAALRLLEAAGVTGALLPRVVWESDDGNAFAYRGLVGSSLQQAQDLGGEQLRAIGAGIGVFLAQLHALDLEGARRWSIDDEVSEYEHKVELSLPTFREFFTAAEVGRVRAFIDDELIVGLRGEVVPLRLGHGDLGPWNVIVAHGGAGVVDFGDVGYWDPAKDFSGRLDATIVDAAFVAYGADDALRRRAALRARALPILDIPFYVGKGDRAGLQTRIDEIRADILAP
jgi:aminoglycoside phosphotransferase (APT) family kinase protein